MNYKALALGAAIGFVVALTPSCSGSAEQCSAANCNGCCNGDQCVTVDQQNVSTCGASGVACAACGANQVCLAGVCETTSPQQDAGTDGGSSCNATTCPNGCCANVGGASACFLGTSATYCGTGGEACSSCAGTGKVCTKLGTAGGACTLPPDAGQPNTGTACTGDTDCTGSNTCRTATSSGANQYTGGYCTHECSQNSPCASDSLCVGVTAYGESAVCLKLCQGAADCRTPGYNCYTVGDQGVCWLDPLPPVDAGPAAPDDLIGSACAANADCQADGGWEPGGCILPTEADGGPSGFPDGYCTADCSIVDCGDTAMCINFGDDGTGNNLLLCTDRCPNGGNGQDDCRPGYVCQSFIFPDGGVSTDGICWQSCKSPGAECAQGTCNAQGYCE